jgi:class 3 adenylate cyclase
MGCPIPRVLTVTRFDAPRPLAAGVHVHVSGETLASAAVLRSRAGKVDWSTVGGDIVCSVARLTDRERAKLPDRAFAFVDASGKRRLPIHDEAHVRNALARFSQVRFETENDRDRARQRLLEAAKKYGIMPVGFVTSQLRAQRSESRLPTGTVTFLLTDIEGSTALLRRLGAGYTGLLRDVRRLIDESVTGATGHKVDAHGDEYFGVFGIPGDALKAAVAMQRTIAAYTWPEGVEVRVRAGLHSGRPELTDSGYVGLSVHTVARICAAAHGGQVIVSGQTAAALELTEGVTLLDLGSHRFAGLPRDELLFQVVADGLLADFPPLRIVSTSP